MYDDHDSPRASGSGDIEFSGISMRFACTECGGHFGYTKLTDYHFSAYCMVCDHKQTQWTFSHHELLGASDGRETRFIISNADRLEVIQRDRYRCVYCNNEAISFAEAQEMISDILSRELGAPWQQILGDHESDRCTSCHQYLPGIVLRVPIAIARSLSGDGAARIFEILRGRFLEVDHLIAVSIQRGMRRLERDVDRFLRRQFLATTCGNCNMARGSKLQDEHILAEIIVNNIATTEAQRTEYLGLLKRAHFEARIVVKKLSETG